MEEKRIYIIPAFIKQNNIINDENEEYEKNNIYNYLCCCCRYFKLDVRDELDGDYEYVIDETINANSNKKSKTIDKLERN